MKELREEAMPPRIFGLEPPLWYNTKKERDTKLQ